MRTKMMKLGFIFTIIVSLTLCCRSLNADTIIVNPGESIQAAIDSAQADDIVLVIAGTYDQGDIVMKDAVDLVGANYKIPEYGTTTIVGKITAANNAELKGLTIQKDFTDSVIDISATDLLIESCIVKNLGTAGAGLGISVNPSSSNITVKNTLICVGNHSDSDRGVYLEQASSVTIESCTVHIEADPGALYSEDTACVYSNGSDYTLRNNILTLNNPTLNAVNAGSDTPEIEYNCILGKVSPIALAHKGTLFASPGYIDAANGNFHLAMAVDNEYRSPTIALDSGCPASDFSGEVQLLSEGFGLPVNKAIDLGAYGNTRYTVKTTLPADFNLDGAVNVGDLGILGANYGGMEKTWRTGDATGDGCVNVGDLGVLGANYGRSLE